MEKNRTTTYSPLRDNVLDVAFYLQRIGGGKLENYAQVCFLKWAIEKRILILENDSLIKRAPTTMFFLTEDRMEEESVESLLWNILLEAADEKNKIIDQELKNIVKEEALLFVSLENKLTNDSKNFLIENGFLVEKERRLLYFNLKTSQHSTTKGEKLYNHLKEYFHYLEDLIDQNFDLKNEIESWEEVFTWISLFGLADKVYNKMKKIPSQQLDIPTGMPKQLIETYKKLAPFLDSFSIGFTYASNSMNSGRSCCV
ncbi:putative uncharacterized protein [Tetragenococcus halophilus subsp. halophilus]|uniref:Uncharacterized protein n=1 Tax=Tetragenococcus halophilus (strain DSM 20338 / JCM 20259 / NCIMB 9735 / NBRC 12172) TaxID=945021 RepID=A0AAN1SGP0_TETHN|nr:hypothetical protein [Tetragenococcus halophilus]RQD32740.1 hypothetical protein C7K42_01970 [Tetragenococcus halophilus subsp. halophilus DSM 20339]BAK94688.1 hypothetical protein TEH_13610 [Tetragenococcus halophilus NBRC 12172]GBD58443.1 putative uncharacterized protein [Tetragenococcus halophilus subsp. halophilus]GBD61856.1 putative uncharacterized protein [Tetragenococcus halophilus subsp. halophilus]GBD70492.1 putative uncharacterized protein [Tetragenococcus halophilus subsp. haloph